jgi:hypothetical protein
MVEAAGLVARLRKRMARPLAAGRGPRGYCAGGRGSGTWLAIGGIDCR